MNTAAVLRRQALVEWRLTVRRFGEALNPLVFFAATVALFPMGLSPEPERMAGYAAGVLWVAALLAVLFAQARQFRAEAYNGVLEQLALSPQPLWLTLSAKLVVQWVILIGPLLVLAPACAYALNLPAQGVGTLMLALTLATPTMIVLGSVGAALTVHAHQGGALLTVLVLPMLVPVLIFGARATDIAASGQAADGALLWLAMLAVLSVTLGPFAIAFSLRTNLD
ncbi:MAG: heme exporter protein CcmB [Gammaproteobacteria bacterium]